MDDSSQLVAQVVAWHEANEHQQIITAIEATPESERGYELTCLLARAYNNLAEPNTDDYVPHLERALALLRSVEADGLSDPLWYFRTAYTLYYLDRDEEALPYLEQCLALDPNDHAAVELREACVTVISRRTEIKPVNAERVGAYFSERDWAYDIEDQDVFKSGFYDFFVVSKMETGGDWNLGAVWIPDVPLQMRNELLEICQYWNSMTRRPKTYLQTEDNGVIWVCAEQYEYAGFGMTDDMFETSLHRFLHGAADFFELLAEQFPQLVPEEEE